VTQSLSSIIGSGPQAKVGRRTSLSERSGMDNAQCAA
jgi:hypothetical protein